MRAWVRTASIMITTLAANLSHADPLIDRGEYLVKGIIGCGDCHTAHTKPPSPFLSGGFRQSGGQAITPNITPDPDTGIGRWTDEQIVFAIRNGKRPDGTTIGPPMPIQFYAGISDDDAKAIVAYLRTVPPVKNQVAKSEYKTKLPDSYGPTVVHVDPPSADDPVKLGAYLAGPLGHCMECHTPAGTDGKPDLNNKLGAGGREFPGPWGVVPSANITPTGLGHFSDAELKKVIATGVKPDGSKIIGPMEVTLYERLTDRDLSAIIAYLRSLPPKG